MCCFFSFGICYLIFDIFLFFFFLLFFNVSKGNCINMVSFFLLALLSNGSGDIDRMIANGCVCSMFQLFKSNANGSTIFSLYGCSDNRYGFNVSILAHSYWFHGEGSHLVCICV